MPEADVAGGPWTGSQAGIPLHVTLLYPFVPPERVDDGVVAALAEVLEPFPPLRYSLAGVCAFGDGTTYLAPVPAEPFVEVTRALVARWPEHPRYGGGFDTIVPHVTVPPGDADVERLASLVPIEARAEEAWLMVQGPERWTTRARFRFSG